MSRHPSVSVLIPAFRPGWLDVAVASALAQTHTDLEILVSDDSAGTAVESVMAKWVDPRVRYFRNPQRGEPGANRNHLIAQAEGQYLKFLFDDDFLLPRSVELLVQAVRESGAKLAFHARHLVDEHGKTLASPSIIEAGTIAALPPTFLFENLIADCANPIGEPTNILVDAAALRGMREPFALEGRRMRFLTDVTLYTNFAAAGHVIAGVGYFGSAFRQHGSQTSGAQYAGFSAGYYEWELLRRWAADTGRITHERFARGNAKQLGLYRQWASLFPELDAFIALEGAAEDGLHLGPLFLEALSLADATIEMRKLSRLH